MRYDRRMSITGFVAIMLSAYPIRQLVDDPNLAVSGAFVVALILAIGVGLRRLRLPGPLVAIAQAAALLGMGAIGLQALTPSGTLSARLTTAFAQAVHHVQTHPAPMPADPAVGSVVVVVLGIIAILFDICAISARTPGAALVPLGTWFAVVAVTVPTSLSAIDFLPVALGWCAILLAAEANRARAWISPTAVHGLTGRRSVGVARPLGAAVIVLSVTLAVSSFLPAATPLSWPGSGSASVVFTDPRVDLRRALVEQSDQVMLRYTTDAPDPAYLRMATLGDFDAAGWQPTDQTLRYGSIPTVPGQPSSQAPRYTTAVEIDQLASQWLPLPYAPRRVTTSRGHWGFATESLDAVANDPVTAGMTYETEWIEVRPTAQQLQGATVGNPREGERSRALPADLPTDIRSLAEEVTANTAAPDARAQAIQAYLRSSRFTYSTDEQPGTGYEALTRFLFDDRTGYCEQFASAFAILGRAVGLPTRVVVGFTPGELADGTYTVTGEQMHAWPEVFYQGLGWVSYEPTPGAATTPVDGTQDPTPSPAASPASSTPSATTTAAATASPSGAESPTPPATVGGPPSRLASWAVGGALVVVAAGALPAFVRKRQRRRRWAELSSEVPTGRAEAAWQELSSTMIDLGYPWSAGSPRQQAESLTRLFPLSATSVGVLAAAIEQARFAREPNVPPDLAPHLDRVCRQATSQASVGRRVWATLLPMSLWRRT